MQTSGSGGGVPTDKPIPVRALPGRRTEQQAGHGTAPTLPHQILQVLPYRTAVAQVMMPMEQDLKESSLLAAARATDFGKAQGQQPGQPARQRSLAHRMFENRHSLVPHAIGRGTAPEGQMNPPALVQLQEQGPSGHVFKLAGRRAPVPQPGQFHANAPPAPIGVSRQKLLHLGQFFGPDAARLENFAFVHGRSMAPAEGRVPHQMQKSFRQYHPADCHKPARRTPCALTTRCQPPESFRKI